jgi:hypothetical protein
MALALQESTFNTVNSTTALQLIHKEQLNSIITNKDGSPDYLAINIYYDSLRSWYSPKKQYQEAGNVIHIRKLKSDGIYYSAEKLAKTHGCSKETIRKKLVKLELLGLIHRNFEHKSTATTNSYNHRCIFVWKNTPHFYNPYGVDRKNIKELKSQTNAEYVQSKHGVEFGAKAKEDIILEEGGGIHTLEDTKELREYSNKLEYRYNAHARESISCNNSNINHPTNNSESVDIKKIVSKESDIVATDTQATISVVSLQNKHRAPNKRKKPLKSAVKAKIIRVTFYSKPKTLADMHQLLDQGTYDELRFNSGRDFSNNFISQKVLAISKKHKITASFKTKQGFISYMTLALRYEMHDAVKTSGNDFCLTANLTAEDKQYSTQEKLLNEVEQMAITHVCPENQLKAKIAGRLEAGKAYQLLSSLKRFEIVEDVIKIHLTKQLELTENDKDIILSQAKAVYSTASGISVECVERVEFVVSANNNIIQQIGVSPTNQSVKHESPPLELPKGIWGEISQKLIEEIGVDSYRNWLSKLTAKVDEEGKTIILKAPSEFVKDWLVSNYDILLQNIARDTGMQIHWM